MRLSESHGETLECSDLRKMQLSHLPSQVSEMYVKEGPQRQEEADDFRKSQLPDRIG